MKIALETLESPQAQTLSQRFAYEFSENGFLTGNRLKIYEALTAQTELTWFRDQVQFWYEILGSLQASGKDVTEVRQIIADLENQIKTRELAIESGKIITDQYLQSCYDH